MSHAVHGETLKASLDGPHHAVPGPVEHYLRLSRPCAVATARFEEPADLGGNDKLFSGYPRQGASYAPLGPAQPVYWGGIEVPDPRLVVALDCGDGEVFLVVRNVVANRRAPNAQRSYAEVRWRRSPWSPSKLVSL